MRIIYIMLNRVFGHVVVHRRTALPCLALSGSMSNCGCYADGNGDLVSVIRMIDALPRTTSDIVMRFRVGVSL